MDGRVVVPVGVLEDVRGGEDSDGESIPKGTRTFNIKLKKSYSNLHKN